MIHFIANEMWIPPNPFDTPLFKISILAAVVIIAVIAAFFIIRARKARRADMLRANPAKNSAKQEPFADEAEEDVPEDI